MTYKNLVLTQEPLAYAVVTDDPVANFGSAGGTFTESGPYAGTEYNWPLPSGASVSSASGTRGLSINTGSTNVKVWTLSFLSGHRTSSPQTHFSMPEQFGPFQLDDTHGNSPVARYQTYNSSNGGLISGYYTYSVGNAPVDSNAMTHWTLRRNGTTTIEVFRNGVKQGSGIVVPWARPTSDSLTFSWGTSPTDHYAYWDRALSDEEILAQATYNGAPVGGAWTVLENGLEVPLRLAGESIFYPASGTPSPVVTGADRYYNGQEKEEIEIPLAGSNRDDVTYSVWARIDAMPATRALVAHQKDTTTFVGGYNLYFATSGQVIVNAATATGVSVSPLIGDGQFHHFALTASGTSTLLYIDGVHRYTHTRTDAIANLTRMYFGNMQANTSRYPFDGEIREAAVIGRQLSAAEIADIHTNGYYVPERYDTIKVTPWEVIEPALSSYWDYQALNAVVDAEGSISTSPEGTAFLDAYSFAMVGNYDTNAEPLTGYTTEGLAPHSPEYKNGLKTFFKEMSKYPPEFVRLLNIAYPTMVKNLGGPIAGRDYGGLAQGDRFWFDVMGFPTYNTTYWGVGGNNGMELIIHHELQHMMRYTYAAEFTAMINEWNALNSLPYIGDDYATLDPNVRPPGHFRMYGRHSFDEDVADVLAFMMTTPLQPVYEQVVAEDAAVAAKVQMVKDWLGAKNYKMGTSDYFTAIHNP